MKIFHKYLYVATVKGFEVISDGVVVGTTEERCSFQQPVLVFLGSYSTDI